MAALPEHLLEPGLYTVEVVDGPVVILRRTKLPFTDESTLALAHDNVDRLLEEQKIDRHRSGLVIDLRQVRGRNDPEFERRVRRERIRMESGFSRVGVIVRTEIGRLQMNRYAQEDGIFAECFFDEQEALLWVRQGLTP